jgi:hypothetical protein
VASDRQGKKIVPGLRLNQLVKCSDLILEFSQTLFFLFNLLSFGHSVLVALALALCRGQRATGGPRLGLYWTVRRSSKSHWKQQEDLSRL